MTASTSPTPLDVFLNGARNYVQGTQLLARAAESVGGEGLLLRSAGFHRITDQNVGVVSSASRDNAPQDSLGDAVFQTSDKQDAIIFFVPLPGQAPRREVPPSCSYERAPASPQSALSGDFAVAGLKAPEDFLVALIQTVKLLHEELGKGVSDIWFTGLRAANIPASGPFPVEKGLLELRYRRLLGRDLSWQSLLGMRFLDPAGAVIAKSMISFAFKSEHPPHVD